MDPTGKMAGRGAYLHEQKNCWKAGIESALSRALRTELTAEEKERLTKFMAALPE